MVPLSGPSFEPDHPVFRNLDAKAGKQEGRFIGGFFDSEGIEAAASN